METKSKEYHHQASIYYGEVLYLIKTSNDKNLIINNGLLALDFELKAIDELVNKNIINETLTILYKSAGSIALLLTKYDYIEGYKIADELINKGLLIVKDDIIKKELNDMKKLLRNILDNEIINT